ncbi:hypothetical protein PoB_005632100 [Plakobranchus ocellatus]|uniref:Uncharacterized protein n=1 Tax=Plakobranchus ocellatus TaxID=259542 RepID=A0AAV4C392_9GAST|nr:hypothetical protein PoB_005632100 [Plakobranchus ocellatus]
MTRRRRRRNRRRRKRKTEFSGGALSARLREGHSGLVPDVSTGDRTRTDRSLQSSGCGHHVLASLCGQENLHNALIQPFS